MAMACAPPPVLLLSNSLAFPAARSPYLSSPPNRSLSIVCNSGGSGCCGGNGSSGGGSSGGGGSCSSHGKNSLSNLGKEFEHLVATNTLLEFEKEYISAPVRPSFRQCYFFIIRSSNGKKVRIDFVSQWPSFFHPHQWWWRKIASFSVSFFFLHQWWWRKKSYCLWTSFFLIDEDTNKRYQLACLWISFSS